MKRQLHESYRRLRQKEGISLAELSQEADIPKPALLGWELGRMKMLQCDIRRYFLGLKALIRRRVVRAATREAVRGRAELRPRPSVRFAEMGKAS